VGPHQQRVDEEVIGSRPALGSIHLDPDEPRAVATPLQLAGGVDGPEQIELAFAAGATRVVVPMWAVAEDPERLRACLALAGDWLAVGVDGAIARTNYRSSGTTTGGWGASSTRARSTIAS